MDHDQASASPVRFRADVGFQVPGEVPSRSRFPAPSERTGKPHRSLPPRTISDSPPRLPARSRIRREAGT
jgi:hypothetical protein